MTPSRLDDISVALTAAFPKLSALEERAAFALYRLLAEGTPVTTYQISVASGVACDAVQEMLGKWHGVDRNPHGAVIGFWGLTISDTKHRLRIRGRQLYTWCAWDALFLPALLDSPALVESACPVSTQRIELEITPAGVQAVRPATSVLSFLIPRASEIKRSVTENFCCYIHFFASRDAAEEWVSKRTRTFVLTLQEAWQLGHWRNAVLFPSCIAERSPGR